MSDIESNVESFEFDLNQLTHKEWFCLLLAYIEWNDHFTIAFGQQAKLCQFGKHFDTK